METRRKRQLEEHLSEDLNPTDTNNRGRENLQGPTNERAKKKRRTSIPRIIDSESPFYAIEKTVDDNVEVRCKECNKIRKGNLNSTGNFIAHYKNKHGNLFDKLSTYLKPVEAKKSIEFDNEPASREQLTECLMNLVVDKNLPFSFVRSPALQELLEIVARRKIIMPSTNFFMKFQAEKFESMKIAMTKLLSEQKYMCLTCDVWSSRANSFIGMTVHFLTKKFERKSYVLAFRRMKSKQTHLELSRDMTKVIKDYGINNNQLTHIVTDGGSAYCKAFKVFGGKQDRLIDTTEGNFDLDGENDQDLQNMPYMIEDDGELFYSNILSFDGNDSADLELNDVSIESNSSDKSEEETDFFRDISPHENDNNSVIENHEEENSNENMIFELPPQRRCLSHLLNLIAKDFEKSLTSIARTALMTAINKLHALWVYTHRSSEAKAICQEVIGCCLLVPCETRWNGKYDAIFKAMKPEIRPKINFLIQRLATESKKQHLQTLTNNDWAVLAEYLKAMSPVAKALDRLQGEKNASQGFILPTLTAMRHHIYMIDGNNIANQFKKTMLEAIDTRFGRYFGINNWNKDLVLSSLSLPRFKYDFFESDADKLKARELLKSECYLISNAAPESENISQLPVNVEDDFFISFSNRLSSRRPSIESEIDSEINRYFNDERTNESCLDDYKHIREIYFKYNTTLSASAAVERVFSQSLLIFRPRRNRISADNFERTLLLKYNRSLLEKKTSDV